MKNIKPCYYCGGEVEVVRLKNDKETGERRFRIECRKCHALTERGVGFKDEPKDQAEQRIRDYDDVMAKLFSPLEMRFCE